MSEGVEPPNADPEEAVSIAFQLRDQPEQSLLTLDVDGVFGPVICVSWEEARSYALTRDDATEPFEITRERLMSMSVVLGFTGMHIIRVHEGQIYRAPEPFS